MEFRNCESIDYYLSETEINEQWFLILPPEIYTETFLTSFSPEKPVKRWVRPDGVQKWVIGNGTYNHSEGAITISVDPNGNNTLVHETNVHSVLGTLPSIFLIGRSTSQSRVDSLDIMVNELETRLRALSQDSVRTHDKLREEQLRLMQSKECELEMTKLITILRERVANRDSEIVSLKEDKASFERKIVDLETSLEISNASLREQESTIANKSLLNVSFPIRATELRVTANPRLTISKQDVCVGSYKLHIVEEDTFYINSEHWFSVEITENAIKRMLVRWMSGYYPTSRQNGSAVSRQMPIYRFTPKDILELVSRATGSNFFLTGLQTYKECDWQL